MSLQITVELPDDIACHSDPGREALQALAIEGYRSEKLTHYQAARLLGMTRFEFDGFLKDRQIYDHADRCENATEKEGVLSRKSAWSYFHRPPACLR